MQVFLFFRAYILEIMIVIFGMEMDATVNFFGTLRKFHDDNGSLFLHIFLYFFGGNDTGNNGQAFLLAGNVESCTGTCCNEGGDTGNVLHRNIVGLQFLKDIVYGRIETCISFGNDADFFIFFMKKGSFAIHFIVSCESLFSVLTHRQCKAGEGGIWNIQCMQYVGSTREYPSACGASFRTKDTIGILQGFQAFQGDKVRFAGTEG